MGVNIWDKDGDADYARNKLHIALKKNNLPTSGAEKGTYIGRIVKMGVLTKETIVKDVVTLGKNEGVDYDTLLRLWDVFEAAAIDRLVRGFRVKGEICEAKLSVRGTFASRSEKFDPEKHSIEPSFKAGKGLLAAVSNAEVEITQSRTTAPSIREVYDAESGTSDRLSPNGFLDIKGVNIRLAGNADDVGVYFVNADNGTEYKVDPKKVSQNHSGKVSVIIPPLEKGSYIVRIKTQYIGSTTTFRKDALSAQTKSALTVS